jgi:hypothetical protein
VRCRERTPITRFREVSPGTPVALRADDMLRGLSLASSLLVATAGCSAQQVRTAGYVTAATGGLVVAGGVLVAAGCTETTDAENPNVETADCTSDDEPPPEATAFAVGGGLALIVVGLAIAAAPDTGKAKTSTPPPYGNGNLY